MEGRYILRRVLSFYQKPSSAVTALNSTKLCHMFGREPDMKMVIEKFGIHPSYNVGPKNCLFTGR